MNFWPRYRIQTRAASLSVSVSSVFSGVVDSRPYSCQPCRWQYHIPMTFYYVTMKSHNLPCCDIIRRYYICRNCWWHHYYGLLIIFWDVFHCYVVRMNFFDVSNCYIKDGTHWWRLWHNSFYIMVTSCLWDHDFNSISYLAIQ